MFTLYIGKILFTLYIARHIPLSSQTYWRNFTLSALKKQRHSHLLQQTHALLDCLSRDESQTFWRMRLKRSKLEKTPPTLGRTT